MSLIPFIQAGLGIASLFGGDPAKESQKQQQALVDKNVGRVNQGFKQFDDRFFKNVRQNYLAAHEPKLDRYFKQKHRQTLFNTARQGQLGSSQEIVRTQALKAEEVSQRNALANQTLAYEKDLRLKIEDQRQNLIQQARTLPNSNLTRLATQKRRQALQLTPFNLPTTSTATHPNYAASPQQTSFTYGLFQ